MNRHTLAAAALVLGVAAGLIVAGPLDPPHGPVTSTYKTLADVEPRIPISSPRTISEPGSYYLTRDVAAGPNQSAITVTASNVTIDLNGYSLLGGPNTAKAIVCVGTPDTIVVRNGFIRDWGQRGIEAPGARNSRFENLSVIGCGLDGISCGDSCVISNCVASDNGEDGIDTGVRCVVVNCTASGNTMSGFAIDAFSSAQKCAAAGNGSVGFRASPGSHVSDCVAARNAMSGIHSTGATIIGNTCTGNGTDGEGAGIHVVSGDSRIEGNHVANNDYGVRVTGGGNLIIRNSASGNSAGNYVLVAGNAAGPLLIPSYMSGNSNPHANYDF